MLRSNFSNKRQHHVAIHFSLFEPPCCDIMSVFVVTSHAIVMRKHLLTMSFLFVLIPKKTNRDEEASCCDLMSLFVETSHALMMRKPLPP